MDRNHRIENIIYGVDIAEYLTRNYAVKNDEDFYKMADACIDNHGVILRHGSRAMQLASRLLLYSLAEESLRRMNESSDFDEAIDWVDRPQNAPPGA